MSFVTTQPEALTYAAGKLQTLGSAIAAESAAAAPPTTGLVPAAADEVSALQATIFAAYGTLYQSVNAQATAIHDLFVNTLGASAGSYATTESANSLATASPLSQQISGLFGSAADAAATDPPGSALANIVNIGTGNWDSAASDLLGLCGGGLLPAANETGEIDAVAPAGVDGTVLTGAAAPPAPAGLGALAVAPGLGQASPPTWATGGGAAATPGAVTTAGWTAPAAQGAPATTVPAAVPAVATAGKTAGYGVPRYGVKPTVMGRSTGV